MGKITQESIQLKNVKVAHNMSEETVAFTASLYINGKKAADVRNDGRGGDNHPWFFDREEEKEFHEFCTTLPPIEDEWFAANGLELPAMNYDTFIGQLLEDWMVNDELKKVCKKKVAVVFKRHTEGEYSTIKGAYTPARAQQVRDHYGDELVEIINERFL